MSVKDMIKKSVLESGAFTNYDVPGILTALAAALLLGALIYLVYRKFYAGVVFSRTFAVTLVGMTVLTCMVTLAISTNVVISLGMVGALSIVRFRTAIKYGSFVFVLGNHHRNYGWSGNVCPGAFGGCDYDPDDCIVLSQTAERKNLYCSDPLYRRPGRG